MIKHIYYWFPILVTIVFGLSKGVERKGDKVNQIEGESKTKTGLWKHALQVVEIIVHQDKIRTRTTPNDYFVGLGGNMQYEKVKKVA